LGGGWSTDVPFKCEDACEAVTVEYLAVDYWCNWSKGWLEVEVEDKSKGEVARELADLSITCESYSANYEGIVLAALEAGNSTNDPQAFASLDSIWGSYIPTWLDNRGRAVDAEGNLLSEEELTFGYTNIYCGEKSEIIKIADTLHDGTIDWIQRVEKIATLEEESAKGYHGVIGILCSGEVEQDVWVDLDECNQGVITRRFRIRSCSEKSPVLELEQKIYIESACGLRKSMFHVPESLEKAGVCVANLEYDGKGNVVLPAETGKLTLRENLEGVLCNGITVRYEDEVYKIAEVSDQYKVERHWTVADWCTHEEMTFVQVIKVNEDPQCAPVVDTSNQVEVYSIAGAIYTEAEEMLSNVSVTAKVSEGSPVTTRTISGSYSFNMQEGTEVDIVPYKNDGHGEGLSTLDVVEIWQHITGEQELESWTSQTAADVDNNGTIDFRDVMELRQLVLQPGSKLANSPSWRFVHRETGREHYRIEDLSRDMELDFMGVKIGDVNTGSDPSRRQERSGLGVVTLQTGDRYLEAGGNYRIAVTSSNFSEITGGQVSLEYLSQWLDIRTIESGALEIGENGQVQSRPGLLHMNWINGQPQTVGKGEVLFTMEVEAKAGGWLRDMIHIDNKSIRSEAYGADRILKNIGLQFTNASWGYALYQNTPNPFEGETTIGFQLPKKDQVVLNIYDVTGRLIKVVEGEYESGHHKVRLRLDELSTGGVMYYQFRSGDYTETKQMILIR
uniref:T9SS type A sorting domain-containing protein n=1 Tax=Membranihabitans maritimus TaxID=2904244 RepID=UPI001F32B783